MSITNGLREYVSGPAKSGISHICENAILNIADRIDAEHERQLEVLYRDMSDAEYFKLPKDADGEPIHIGDVLQWPEDGDTFEVIGIGEDGVLFYFDPDTDGETADWTASQNKRHYHAPTVEDVLHQFLGECDSAVSLGYDEVPHEVFAKYAAMLRLADGKEH